MIKKIVSKIFKKNVYQGLLIFFNIFSFYLIKTIYRIFINRDSYTNYIYGLYFKKVPFKCRFNEKKIKYFFQINTLLAIYESEEFLNELLDNNYECYIDIGANVGRLGSFVASYNDSIKKIYMLEPNKYSYDFSKDQIGKIEFNQNKFCFINKGIGEKSGKEEMFILKGDKLNTMATVKFDEGMYGDKSGYNKTFVDIIEFKDFFLQYDCMKYKSFIIKIDVEGFELEVLKSIFEFFTSYDKDIKIKILVEVWDKNHESFLSYIEQYKKYIEKLEKLGLDYLIMLKNK